MSQRSNQDGFTTNEPVARVGKKDEFGHENRPQIPDWKPATPNWDVPELYPDKKTTKADSSLKWYELIWAGLPLVILFFGGAVGGAMGAMAMVINTKVFKSDLNGFIKYLISGLVSLFALLSYFVLAVLISTAFGR